MRIILIMCLFLIVGCGKKTVSFVDSKGSNLVSSEAYEDYLVSRFEILENKTNSSENSKYNREIFLRDTVIGLSFDVRVGLFKWEKGKTNSIELHLDALPEDEK